MTSLHKNKTFAAFLAAAFGITGIHRFYLYGRRDRWGWLHFLSLPLAAISVRLGAGLAPSFFLAAPLIVAALAGAIESLVLGLTPDSKWDAKHNANSGQQSASRWPLALLLAVTLAVGMTGVIFVMSRSFDLFFTGGAYG